MRANQSTTFSMHISLLNRSTESALDSFDAADWNKDGFLDLITCSSGTVLLMSNDGFDRFPIELEIVKNLTSCGFLKAVDFDSDGDLDLIVDSCYFERVSDVHVEERHGGSNPLAILGQDTLRAVEDWDSCMILIWFCMRDLSSFC